MIRAFIALPIPEDVAQGLHQLQALLRLPSEVDPHDFHLTLAFLGEQPDAVLQEVHEGLDVLSMPGFPLELRGVGLFGGARPRVVWAGVAPSEPLMRLQAKVAQVAVRAGVRVPARSYAPHVTLGRLPHLPPDEVGRLERAVVAQQAFRAGPWLVAESGLYASHGKVRGPKYEMLNSYPLG